MRVAAGRRPPAVRRTQRRDVRKWGALAAIGRIRRGGGRRECRTHDILERFTSAGARSERIRKLWAKVLPRAALPVDREPDGRPLGRGPLHPMTDSRLKFDEIARSEPPRRGFSLDEQACCPRARSPTRREAGRTRSRAGSPGRSTRSFRRSRPAIRRAPSPLPQAGAWADWRKYCRFGSLSRPKSHFTLAPFGTQIAALSSPWGSAFPSRAAMATAAQTTASSLSS